VASLLLGTFFKCDSVVKYPSQATCAVYWLCPELMSIAVILVTSRAWRLSLARYCSNQSCVTA